MQTRDLTPEERLDVLRALGLTDESIACYEHARSLLLDNLPPATDHAADDLSRSSGTPGQ